MNLFFIYLRIYEMSSVKETCEYHKDIEALCKCRLCDANICIYCFEMRFSKYRRPYSRFYCIPCAPDQTEISVCGDSKDSCNIM